MPSQANYGNAPLAPISRVATGIYGLNLQAQGTLLDPKWATQADNMIFNNQGILTTRFGWGSPLNSTPISGSPNPRAIFQYVPISGSNQIITAAGNNLYSGTTTLTSIKGSVGISADNWKFVNFNGNVYGLQTGHPLIVWNGSGNFTTVTAANGTVPNGNELLSAFGRLWGSDSTGQLLKYSLLLDATQWNTTGAGSFNLTSVWGSGNDSIVALAAYNNLLVVFGSKNIIIWGSPTGSILGMDPTTMYVVDMIAGIGCVARDSVKSINGEDLVFLSYTGVQSLKRVIIERSNATRNISMNVRDSLMSVALTEPANNIKSTYDAVSGFYLLSFPSSQSVFVFDTRLVLQDGTWRVTQWNNFYPTAITTLQDNETTYATKAGQIYEYGDVTGMTNDNGAGYTASYSSCWFDLGEELNTRLKMLKRMSSIFSATASVTVNFRWEWDFGTVFSNYQIPVSVTPSAQFGISQFGIDQFGGSIQGLSVSFPTSGKGQYIRLGADFPILNSQCVFQMIEMYAKVGRVI
jgi:hypothetical protein